MGLLSFNMKIIYLQGVSLQQWYLGISAWDPLLRITIYPGPPRSYVIDGNDMEGAQCQIPIWLHPAFHDRYELKSQPHLQGGPDPHFEDHKPTGSHVMKCASFKLKKEKEIH